MLLFKLTFISFIQMSLSGLLKQLEAFAKLPNNSAYILNNGVDLLLAVFTKQKPLFESSEDKSKAYQLLSASLGNLDSSLVKFSGSLNVDKRQSAQKVRSGLQFLVDELQESGTSIVDSDKKVTDIVNWGSVKSLEDFIENTVGIEPEHLTPAPQDLSNIPQSHVWWFYEEDKNLRNRIKSE